MTPYRGHRPRTRGFTLIELLVVIGIIAVLASMLLPAMFAVSQSAKVANADALIKRISVALDVYFKTYAYYPPDYIPVNANIINFQGTKTGSPPGYAKISIPTPAYPPETLYYYLCHRFLSNQHPMLSLRSGSEAMDINENGLPEVVDPWGRPYLYNRPQFPACLVNEYNIGGNPFHNPETYDLYSTGADGQTGDDELPPISGPTFSLFCSRAMNDANDGNKEDDICNWKK